MKSQNYILLLLLVSMAFFNCTSQSGEDNITSADILYLNQLLDADQGYKSFYVADSLLKKEQHRALSPFYLEVLYAKGRALEYLSRYEEALNVYYQLLKLAEQASNFTIEAQTYLSIVRIDEVLYRKEDWERNLQKAHLLIENHELWSVYSEYAVRMASYQRYHGNIDSVFYYGQKAVEFGKKYDNQRDVGDGFFLCGVAAKTDTVKIMNFTYSLNAFKQVNNWVGVAYRYLAIAEIGLKNRNYNQYKLNADSLSVYIYKLAESRFRKERLYDIKEGYYQLYSDYFMSISQQDSAYYYLRESKEFLQLSIVEKANGAINDKAIDIAILASEQKSEALKDLNRALGIILGASIIIGLILFYTIRKINRQKEKLLTKSEKILQQTQELEAKNYEQKMLLSEIHHRVKNNLQLVISILMLKMDEFEDEEFKLRLEEITTKIQSMALIHEQLYRVGNFTNIDMRSYLTDMVQYMSDIGSHKRKIEFKIVIDDDITLNIDTSIPLGILLIELINNSIKHAETGDKQLFIHIGLTKIESDYELVYTDNGLNFNSEKSGMGSVLLSSMARQLKGKLIVNYEDGFRALLTFAQKIVSPLSNIID
ncbi:MAG TPA: sensor histidine kinase [Saprospiraceae bacterium]|nr:sensor histidine kinase [Saprospiraceae bacterium]